MLAAIHRCILNIGKVKKEAKNPRFDSTYATLEQVLDFVNPHLFSEGLVMSQTPGYDGAAKAVTMGLTFISAEGVALNYATSSVPVGKIYPKNADPQEANAQTAIAAQTYLARTQIAHIFRLNLTDDDGNEGTGWKPGNDAPARAATPTAQSKPATSKGKVDFEDSEGNIIKVDFVLKNRGWTLNDMSVVQLTHGAYTESYPANVKTLCLNELVKRVAAGDKEAETAVNENSK